MWGNGQTRKGSILVFLDRERVPLTQCYNIDREAIIIGRNRCQSQIQSQCQPTNGEGRDNADLIEKKKDTKIRSISTRY
jgi:hypothetical protein